LQDQTGTTFQSRITTIFPQQLHFAPVLFKI